TEESLAQHLTAELQQLAQYLTDEGYTVFDYHLSGGMPETLRTFLQDLHTTNNIEGALFIGDLPVAWFEVYDFGGSLAEFPIDLFYMDLDGTWLDTISTGNGRYDGHVGNTKPEIYIARLMPTGIGTDTTVLKRYFEKITAYRDGLMPLRKRALVFVDDDWVPWAMQWSNDVALLFPDTMSYWYPDTTKASLYRERLDSTQIWVSVFAHSWPGGHQFVFDSGNQHDYYYANEYTNQNPPTSFYNFFACSFSRYTQNGYGGGRAIFNEDYGIGSIGSTKSGSMLDFNYFYRPLSEGKTLGEAFKYWFECIYDSVGMNFDRLCWHYGMTLLGDPFLKPTGHNTSIADGVLNAHDESRLQLKHSLVSQHIDLVLNVDRAQEIRIVLYDCVGRFVVCLMDEYLEAGNHTLTINLRNAYGGVLPNGVYVLRAVIGNSTSARKFVKID
ncbi:hypothetical protein KAS45_04215, partial [candidate division WOR-3 bacterium]|nr:hypothetical protein [candidate division WOR-3 bacterium]